MKLLIQRVKSAEVEIAKVDNTEVVSALSTYSKIEKGYLVFVGISDDDTKEIADKMLQKMIGLRIFEDENGKTNLSLKDVDGDLLIVSQFTLYANCQKGNRPSFIRAGKPEFANEMYEYVLKKAEELHQKPVYKGVFGADMKVSLINDGPFTIMLDSNEICKVN